MNTAPPPLPERPRTPLWRRLAPVVGLALLVWFLSRLDHRAVLSSLKAVSVPALVGAAAFMAANVAVKAHRWRRLLAAPLRRRDIALDVAVFWDAFIESAVLGSVTIGRLGEFVRAGRLAGRGVPASLALASCLMDRAMDLAFLAAFALVALLWLFTSPLAAMIAAVCLPPFFLLVAPTLARLLLRLVPEKWQRLHRSAAELLELSSRGALAELLFWTAIAWACSFGMTAALAWQLAPAARLITLSGASAIAMLTALVPISFQGLGTREPVFAATLQVDGVLPEAAVALSLANFSVSLVSVLLLGALFAAVRRLLRAPRR
jgi:uncharacterized membrane protein YbhN (UPF0104 family)